jgi:hypothetical protein
MIAFSVSSFRDWSPAFVRLSQVSLHTQWPCASATWSAARRPTTMSLRTVSGCPPSQRPCKAPSQALILLDLPPESRLASAFPRLSHSLVDHYPRPKSSHLCSSYSRLRPSLPDHMLSPPSRILLGRLLPACRHFFLSLTAARVPQPRRRFLPSITTPSSRRHRSLIILSAECMHTLIRHFRPQLRLPISPANYVLARCLCPLIRPLPRRVMLLKPNMTPQLIGTLGAGATKIL